MPHISDEAIRKGMMPEGKQQTTESVIELVVAALETDGEHHKQWYLQKILDVVVRDIKQETDEGVAP